MIAHRYNSNHNDSCLSGTHYAMFAFGDACRVAHYGPQHWIVDSAGLDALDVDAIRSAWDEDKEDRSLAPSIEDFEINDFEIDPDDIVDSAGLWDDPAFCSWYYDRFESDGVVLSDGIILFEEFLAERIIDDE